MYSLTKFFAFPERATQGKPRPFRLLRYFTLFSLVSILVASLLLGGRFRQISEQTLINNEERNNIAVSQVLSNVTWPKFSRFLNKASGLSADEIRKHPDTIKLDASLENQIKGLSIYKIKIYSLEGYTVYSTDFSQIGKSKKNSPSFKAALEGKVISKLSYRDSIYARKELIENRNILSSYIPIRRHAGANIEGVFEVYKDVTPLINEISSTQSNVISGVLGVLSGLFFILFFVVRHADKIINQFNLEQNKAAEKMRFHAFHDGLTGLPNRFLFIDRLEHALTFASREKRLVALMFIDLDRFKQINDNLGHEYGDQLLFQVAQRLRDSARESDTVARISGDEFTILLEGLQNINRVTEIAQRIVSYFAKPFELNDREVQMTCSIGISVYPFQDDNAQTLIKKADVAMYRAKERGRNNYMFYSADMQQSGTKAFNFESDLRNALDNDQFLIYLQPKINLNDCTLTGMEALLRWKHPEEGLIMPDRFIPLLEETGLIAEVGEWVLRQSCQMVRNWQDEGLTPVKVAVNVSNMQLRQFDFIKIVKRALSETGIDPIWLELELTESCLIDDLAGSIDWLEDLKELGVSISLDDFGTGFSSLDYLCRLPIDTIKIDRFFVKDMIEKRHNRAIVTALISLAHNLKLDVVAEGVETTEQLHFLSAMRCSSAQGFLLSKPLPVEEFDKLYRNKKQFEEGIIQLLQRASSA